MSQAESIKEELGLLKVFLGILAATNISLIAWIFQNFESGNQSLVAIAIAAVLFATTIMSAMIRVFYIGVKKLEKL